MKKLPIEGRSASMTIVDKSAATSVRPFRREDEDEVVALLGASLGAGPAGTRSVEFFRWKHLQSPFGESFMLVAETDGRIVGFRAFMRWRFTWGESTVTAVRAVDTATHPEYQRRGIFSKLTLTALDRLRGEADLIFNTPNERSLPGYLKMGWRTVGLVPIRVQIRRPIRFARYARSLRGGTAPGEVRRPLVEAPSAADALRDHQGLSRLLEQTESFPARLSTSRSVEYLRWRYGMAPLLDYRAIVGDDGLAVFRVRPRGRLWETTLAELIVPVGGVSGARRLLRAVAKAADVDHLTSSFPAGSIAARAGRRKTMPAPGGMTLVAHPLQGHRGLDPGSVSSWALTLGDLEVF
jgi:GNAT superfamily N-acetyltransferase